MSPALAALAQAAGNQVVHGWDAADFDAVLMAGNAAEVLAVQQRLAALPGKLVPLFVGAVAPVWLMRERCVTTNTAAVGGNAGLLVM